MLCGWKDNCMLGHK